MQIAYENVNEGRLFGAMNDANGREVAAGREIVQTARDATVGADALLEHLRHAQSAFSDALHRYIEL
jgi:hypothetical protein